MSANRPERFQKQYRSEASWPGSSHLRRHLVAWSGWLLAMSYIPGALAVSYPDIGTDPLGTRPPVLDTGATLPGDATPLLCPPPVDLSESVSLSDVVDLALCSNPQIKAAWASIKVQAAALGEARAAYWPTLSGTVSQLHTSTVYPGVASADTSSEGHTMYGAFNWRIFDFGARAANRDAADALLLAAMAQHDATIQKTLSATVGAYFEALTAQAALQARTQARVLAQRTLEATQRRETRGAAGRNDTLQAQTASAKAQLAEQRARGDLTKAMSVLVYTIGLPQQSELRLAAQDTRSTGESMEDLSRWIESTQRQHPAIAAARAQWVAAKDKVISARSDGLPTLDFGANYYQNGYPNQGLQPTRSTTKTIGVTLTIPFFDGFARTYKIRGAEAQVEQSEAQWQDVERQILGDVVKAYADAQSSLANLASSEELLRAAQTALTSSQNRYDRGAADILELLSVQNALADAEQERIRCLSEWHAARLTLLAASGRLGRIQ